MLGINQSNAEFVYDDAGQDLKKRIGPRECRTQNAH